MTAKKAFMNLTNRTLFIADNLEVMRSLDDECVDLIYLDPPFNTKKQYQAPIGSRAEGASFKDIWNDEDVNPDWHDDLTEKNPATCAVIHAAKLTHGESMKAYLIMLGVRLLEMHRILKSTGSIYLHCDPTASHYLKMIMDSIFGKNNFRNEIIWKRRGASNNSTNKFGRIHDTILFYTINKNKAAWNPQYEVHNKDYIKKSYSSHDAHGQYRNDPLTQQGTNQGESSQPWHNFNPANTGRVWAAPIRGSNAKYIEKHFIPNYRQITSVHERLDALNKAGLICQPNKGEMPSLKRYLASNHGRPTQDIITNINFGPKRTERTGYPTQKPVALLERIIKASSNEGDLVLDPFCGCATTCIAAEKLNRQWVGIDISESTEKLAKIRFKEEVDTQMPLFKPPVNINVQRTSL